MPHQQYSLSEWCEVLENRYPEEIQLGLKRVSKLVKKLQLQPKVPVITVAGTNGKGSTVRSLEAIYQAVGYRVASYTSPHLIHFNERICINQKPCTDEEICRAFCDIERFRGDVPLSYFEFITVAALWHFKQSALDVIILEVGLGGRLDATNAIDADVAIITTVDLDHQTTLGDTKEAIAKEKAGIIRPNKPVIFGDTSVPEAVVSHASALNAPLYCLERDYQFEVVRGEMNLSLADGQEYHLPLPNIHLKSAAAALLATDLLKTALPLDKTAWRDAMNHVFIPGRKHAIHQPVNTVLDVAHNPQSALELAQFLKQYIKIGGEKPRVHAVFSALMEKDIRGIIRVIKDDIDTWYPARLSSKRATEPGTLLNLLTIETGKEHTFCYPDPLQAYRAAIKHAHKCDIIVVFGSFLTVSPVLSAIQAEERGDL